MRRPHMRFSGRDLLLAGWLLCAAVMLVNDPEPTSIAAAVERPRGKTEAVHMQTLRQKIRAGHLSMELARWTERVGLPAGDRPRAPAPVRAAIEAAALGPALSAPGTSPIADLPAPVSRAHR